jgi:hypothetical protein
VTLGAIGFGVYGFVWGYFWARTGPVFALVPTLTVAALLFFVRRRAERHIERVAKERIRYMRGGQGEALIAWLLEDLDNDWHIFNCLKLEADSDIDHVLVGPGGVYCISTKSHRGLFTGTADGLFHNGQPSPFAQQAMRQTLSRSLRFIVTLHHHHNLASLPPHVRPLGGPDLFQPQVPRPAQPSA